MNIVTERLILVPITQKYAIDIFENFTDEVAKFMFPCPAKDISETESLVENWITQREEGTDNVYAITLKETSEFIGTAGIHDLHTDVPELGIWTKIMSHGNHYGREAIGGLIAYAKKHGYTKLAYPVGKKNIASKKIPLFYGGKVTVSDGRFATTPDGRILDEVVFEISL